MFKTIALCASLLVPAFALADETPAPAGQTETAQPAKTEAPAKTQSKTKVSKVRKTSSKKGQGRSGVKTRRASKSVAK